MTSDCRAGTIAPCARWICLAALLSGLTACGGGNDEAPQAVGSDGDSVESAPPVAEQQPDPEPGPLQCKDDNPVSSEIVLLAGQSNANEGLLSAIDKTLTKQGAAHSLGHHYVGGNPIASWMFEDGTPGVLWAPMMNAFDLAISKAAESDQPISALTFVWFQGEADVYPNNYPFYEARLRELIKAIEAHAETNWASVPKPVFSLAQPEHKTPHWRQAMDTIRASIATVADDADNVCAFDTQDIRRVDVVHLPNPTTQGSPEQLIAAERALACARVAANRCDRTKPGQ